MSMKTALPWSTIRIAASRGMPRAFSHDPVCTGVGVIAGSALAPVAANRTPPIVAIIIRKRRANVRAGAVTGAFFAGGGGVGGAAVLGVARHAVPTNAATTKVAKLRIKQVSLRDLDPGPDNGTESAVNSGHADAATMARDIVS